MKKSNVIFAKLFLTAALFASSGQMFPASGQNMAPNPALAQAANNAESYPIGYSGFPANLQALLDERQETMIKISTTNGHEETHLHL